MQASNSERREARSWRRGRGGIDYSSSWIYISNGLGLVRSLVSKRNLSLLDVFPLKPKWDICREVKLILTSKFFIIIRHNSKILSNIADLEQKTGDISEKLGNALKRQRKRWNNLSLHLLASSEKLQNVCFVTRRAFSAIIFVKRAFLHLAWAKIKVVSMQEKKDRPDDIAKINFRSSVLSMIYTIQPFLQMPPKAVDKFHG